jgi:hypothetical protein
MALGRTSTSMFWDSMTYSNVEQESIEFVRYSLTAWPHGIDLAVSSDRDLAFERQFVRFEGRRTAEGRCRC